MTSVIDPDAPVPAIVEPASRAFPVPAIVAAQGDRASERFFTFFTDTIRNKNTRMAYYRNACRFMRWAEGRGERSDEARLGPDCWNPMMHRYP